MVREASTEAEAPSVGRWQLLRELWRDPWGIYYEGVDSPGTAPRLIWIIDAQLCSGDNFSVRFELLRALLPAIQHDNLLRTVDMGKEGSWYYVAKQMPAGSDRPLTRLSEMSLRDLPNRQATAEQIYGGVAAGLAALEAVSDSYFQEGIVHDALHPTRIFIDFEPALVGTGRRAVARLDGFTETFLFFGDSTQAHLQRAIAAAHWHQQRGRPARLHDELALLPPSAHTRATPEMSWHQHAFGMLTYLGLTGMLPQGVFPKLIDLDSTLDGAWDDIVDRCLSCAYDSMEQVHEAITAIGSRQAKQQPQVRKVRDIAPPDGMALIYCEDKCTLGSGDGPANEEPAFRAKVRPFFIDLHPVTNRQFKAFLTDYRPSTYSRGDRQPATLTSWHMAKAYCRWRSTQEGLPPDTYRLPTEYEWEAAVRGTSGHQYPWGAEMEPQRLNAGHDKEKGTSPVFHYPPGRFGLYDMLGNCWEWTQSKFGPHPFSTHREVGYGDNLYVAKGGCWMTPAKDCRASLRAAYPPNHESGNIGFRCVRDVE